MKKRILALMLVLTALVFSGCALRTVEEMYSLPRRSEQYNKLQSAIDMAMAGLDYSAPVAGENRQTLQTADLDGDGRDEYLVFAKGTSEKPLQLLIFRQETDGACSIMEAIAFRGSAFEQVEYVNMDCRPGREIVIGRQVSDQLMGSVSVYTFTDGSATQLLSTDYTRFVTADLTPDGQDDLLVLRPGEAGMDFGVAVLYSYRNGAVERSVEAPMSTQAENVKRMNVSRLYGGDPAVYVSSSGMEDAVFTDVFALRADRLVNVAFSGGQGARVDTLKNYAVYAEDLDRDDVFELPRLISMKPITPQAAREEQHLLRWYAMDLQGNETDKLCTFHNFAGGWYLLLSSNWAGYLTMEQRGSSYTFYMWNEDYNKVTILFTISELTGSSREHQAAQQNRFVLHRGEEIIYCAKLETGSAMYGFTEDYLIDSFRLIQQER